MALMALTPEELADTPTLFSRFMGRGGARHKTVGQLLTIYRERSQELAATGDPDDDLRVDRFMHDMASERWQDEVVMRIGVFEGEVRVIDGTHRGIAYLACVQDGVSTDRLPPLRVER